LEHLEEQLFETQKYPPIDGAQIVAVMEVAMVQEFLARARESLRVMAADQSRQRFLPMDRQPLQFFEQCGFYQNFRHFSEPLRRRWE
jgi:hypothetical protein